VRRHSSRVSSEVVAQIQASIAAIDTLHESEAWPKLENEAEQLDELLHEHASFARKGALREAAENIGIAVLVAVSMRSTLYEPFKIPSGSMMPTLRSGDHIFVNKFTYGVQIPFTNTIVAKDLLGVIQRGDVVVFRYPLDEKEDYIKRVMGVPGDTLKVDGRRIYIRPRGEQEYREVRREAIEEPCLVDGSAEQVQENCTLYRETGLDGREYVVRYVGGLEHTVSTLPRILHVPDEHILVMGDNRRMSHDSLAWQATVEAVTARSLLTRKDLHDLTEERNFSSHVPLDAKDNVDPRFDHVQYFAEHASPEASMQLDVWRDPTLGASEVFGALATHVEASVSMTIAELIAKDGHVGGMDALTRDRIVEIGGGVESLRVSAEGAAIKEAVWHLGPSKTVMRLRCGDEACPTYSRLAERITGVLGNFQRDRTQQARELLEGDSSRRYTSNYRSRGRAMGRFVDLHYRPNASAEGDKNLLRLRVWRNPKESLAVLRDAALAGWGSDIDHATSAPEFTPDAWFVETDQNYTYTLTDTSRRSFIVLECGKNRCRDKKSADAMAASVVAHIPDAKKNALSMRRMLGSAQIGDWKEQTQDGRELYEWDRQELVGNARRDRYAVDLKVMLKPKDGLEATVARWRNLLVNPKADATHGRGGFFAENEESFDFVFPVEQNEVVIGIHCAKGLCPDETSARALASRTAQKALDTTNYIKLDASRPRPFVPRGNVKGRAERIWQPLSRFWLKIR